MTAGEWLVVGLGNPSLPGTRHSIGRDVVAAAAAALGAAWGADRRAGAAVAAAPAAGPHAGGARLALPYAAMNDCGRAAARCARQFGVPAGRVVVVHDDMRLPLGAVRLLPAGGAAGGHNGVRSVHGALRSAAPPLLQVGIGRPRGGASVTEHVLSEFADGEAAARDAAVADAAAEVRRLLTAAPPAGADVGVAPAPVVAESAGGGGRRRRRAAQQRRKG